MAIGFGPFQSHVAPGVYTETKREKIGGPPPGIRPLVLIGVGQETLAQSNLDVIRGSSSTADQKISNEDASARFILDATDPNNPVLGPADGVASKLLVRNPPITNGVGQGIPTTSANDVQVFIDGTQVAVAQVIGSRGIIVLQSKPTVGSIVKVNYYFKRSDTLITDDLSNQVTADSAEIDTAIEVYNVTASVNDQLKLTVNNGAEKTVILTAGAGRTAAQVVNDINAALITGLTAATDTDPDGHYFVKLTANAEISIGSGSANSLLGLSVGQNSGRNRAFRTWQRPIVDGSNGGITATNVTDVSVTVNGSRVAVSSLAGANGIITLALPPPVAATVLATYYFNAWQDTYDYLPNLNVTDVLNCGIAPDRHDYVNLSDFVIENGKIYWGTAFSVASGNTSYGSDPFNASQISGLLIDDRIYAAECTRYIDSTVSPSIVSDKKFVLPVIPTTGNGRNSPLGSQQFGVVTQGRIDLPTDRPDLVVAYRGRNVRDALNRGPVTVLVVDSATRIVTLKDTVPPGETVFCTCWYNTLADDVYTLSCVTAGSSGLGRYSVLSALTGTNRYAANFGTKNPSLAETVQWPSGVETRPDAIHFGGNPVNELATVTFSSSPAAPAIFTNTSASPYHLYDGSSDIFYVNVDNAGVLNIDLTAGAPAAVYSNPIGLTVDTTGGNNVLTLKVDGTSHTVTLDVGAAISVAVATPDPSVVAAINTAVGSTVASVVGTGARQRLKIKSTTTPTTLDAVSSVEIVSGTALSALGLTIGQIGAGSVGGAAKSATMISGNYQNYTVVAGVNDLFSFSIDGTSYAVTLTAGNQSASALIALINSAAGSGSAAAATVGGNTYIRLYSHLDTPESKIIIGDGTANGLLGFTTSQSAGQWLPTADLIATCLNNHVTFTTRAIARQIFSSGLGNFLQIESFTTGATSSVAFGTGVNSAFHNTDLGIKPGVSGDSGEAASSGFTVSSNRANGSGTGATNTGIPGQTYTDAVTGLRFTVLPSSTGTYTSGGAFTLNVVDQIVTDANLPVRAIPGLELTVTNTTNVTSGDTALVTTYNKSGAEPAIGDTYYISYDYVKEDFSTQLFTSDQMDIIQLLYGTVSAENHLSLGASIAFQNGVQYIALKQVMHAADGSNAPASAYIAAIDELIQKLPGDTSPYIMIPITTDAQVQSYLENHCAIQSSPRYGQRRIAFVGCASGTKPTAAQAIAKGLRSDRIREVYPDSAIVGITNALGESIENIVDGAFLAVGVGASVLNPAIDFATPYTKRQIYGFKRLGRTLNAVEQSQTATSGIIVLQDTATGIEIMQGFTTDMSELLTQLPTVTQIDDLMHDNLVKALNKYIGVKGLPGLPREVAIDATSVAKAMVDQQLIVGYKPATATVSDSDPTLIKVELYYAPILPNLYVLVTQNIRTKI